MLGGEMYTTIKTLWNLGKNKSQIAELTGHDWKTVSKIVKAVKSGCEYPEKKPHPKMLDNYKDKIIQWLENNLSAVRIHEELQCEGLKIGYSTVKDFVAGIRKKTDIFIRIHTEPGKEAQVDFGYVGMTAGDDGKRHKTWFFHMMLSNSRYSYYEKVYNQRVETFIQCHINAFEYFKGIPECVRIDNLKAAILQANFYEPVYQELYKKFSEYYGFSIIPCRIYSPNDKGKVESGIKYVKKNFFAGRTFKDGQDLDRQLRYWLDHTCNRRTHGTTRKIPEQVFLEIEKVNLKELPETAFKMPKVGCRKVYHDSHVYVDYNYYSVPYEYVGKEVEIEIDQLVRISYNGKTIALHERLRGKGEFATVDSHYPKYKMMNTTEYQEKYQLKMAAIGKFTEKLFFLIIEKQKPYWQRTVQGILSLTKFYPQDVLELACKRALAYNIFQYNVIKNICQNGAYNLPVEFVEQAVSL